MDVNELINSGVNTAIILNADDLKRIIAQTIEETRIETLKQIEKKEEDVFYSVAQVCDILNKNRATLWRWEQKGYLKPATRVGKNALYKKSDVDKLLGKE